MNKRFVFLLAAVLGGGMAMSVLAEGENRLSGEITLGGSYVDVEGDRGLWREDHFRNDGFNYGIERLSLRGRSGPDSLEVALRAWYEYAYDLSVQLTREDQGYLLVQGKRTRNYYDGNNDNWNPAAYGFANENLRDPEDGGYYADRTDVTVEAGLTLPNLPRLVLGWHRWQRQGTEVQLRGERVRVTGDTVPRLRIIPAVNSLDGTSDTLYGEISYLLDDKYEFTLRQEVEVYDDHQTSVFPRYLNGALEQNRVFYDDPYFLQSNTIFMFDSFLNDELYVGASYMYSHLENETTRAETQLPSAGGRHDGVTDNTRDSHSGTTAFKKWNALGLAGVDVRAALRVEQANTTASGSFLDGADPVPVLADTSLDEWRYQETFGLAWACGASTNLSLDADWEQRQLEWAELDDIRKTESFVDWGSATSTFDYATDVEHMNQRYTLRVVNRSMPKVKTTAFVRYKEQDRDYETQRDNNLIFYPGVLGDYTLRGHEAGIGFDWRCGATTTTTLKYQYSQLDISNEVLGDNASEMQAHRVSAGLSGAVTSRLFLAGTVLIEDYQIDTPANVPAGNRWADGSDPYQYEANSYTALLAATYACTANVSTTLDYQFTRADGNIAYRYNRATLGVDYRLSEKSSIRTGVEFFDFDDLSDNGFDNYTASGVFVNYRRIF